ncbi:MAG: acetate/propionate family kinase [Gammaproteobacteria bacterium]|nr:acetate/propionate family kinase [Gammaproteobacteria bacterium]
MKAGSGQRVLVLNAGSSSLKFALFAGLARVWHGQVEGIGTRPRFLPGGEAAQALALPASTGHAAALEVILAALAARGIGLSGIAACGHRIVHGGARFVAPLRLAGGELDDLHALRALAPLHNRFGLEAIDALVRIASGLPQVACFDTAFHATVPEVASRYALPAELHEAGYRRYGFHGLNFEHVTAALAERGGGTPPARLLIFHLGNGCSIAAVRDGRSVGTTMGYSTLDGLVMGTRCGAIDPGVLLALQRDRGLDADALEELLYRRSGLLGVSGRSPDMRELTRSDEEACRFAVEHFSYWAARQAGSLLVALGGLDAIAFTGGIGAGSARVRAQIVAHLAWLGLEIDAARNERNEAELASAGSRCPILIVEADEERVIARHVHAALRASHA